MEDIKRLSRCCFTGHRPEKLKLPETTVKLLLKKAIRQAVQDGYTVFITGMARGADMWAAEIVLEERETNSGIKLVCASPFEGFERSWSILEQQRYRHIVHSADYVRFVCDRYSLGCFQIRNRYMVDLSSRVIAVYNGERGGTRNTINYAEKNNLQVINVLDKNF